MTLKPASEELDLRKLLAPQMEAAAERGRQILLDRIEEGGRRVEADGAGQVDAGPKPQGGRVR